MKRVIVLGLMLGLVLLAAAACGGTAAPTTAPAAQPTTAAANAPAATEVPPTAVQAAVPTDTPLPPPTTAPTVAPTAAPAAGGNPLEAILKAEQLRMTKPVRLKIETTDSSTNKTSSITLESQPPDRFHYVAGGQDMIIIKGKGTWMKAGDKYVKSPVDMSMLVTAFFDPNLIQEMEKSVKTSPPQFVGPDVLGGVPMLVYQYTTTVDDPTGSGKSITSNSKMWIGLTDGLAHQVISDGPSFVKEGATTHSVVTYDYDPNLNIQEPTP